MLAGAGSRVTGETVTKTSESRAGGMEDSEGREHMTQPESLRKVPNDDELRKLADKWALMPQGILLPILRETWQAGYAAALLKCPLCDHEWIRHDPDDGRCDAGPPCDCGRDLAWMQLRIAELSHRALAAGTQTDKE